MMHPMDITTQAIRRTLGVLLLITSLSAVACSSSTPKAAPPAPVLQTDDAGKFRAEFPSAPLREETPITEPGVNLVMITYTHETADEGLVVGYIDYPKGGQTAKMLDGAADGSAANVKGKVQSKTPTTFMGHPAMDVVMKAPEGVVHERLVLRGNRLYMLIGTGPSGRPASYDRLLETFFLI